MSTIVALLLLLSPPPSSYISMDYCAEVGQILLEGVEAGVINKQEAVEIMARCARAPKIEQNSP